MKNIFKHVKGKVWVFFAVLLAVVFLTGCVHNKQAAPPVNTPPSSTSTTSSDIDTDIISRSLYSTIELKELEEFIGNQPGILNSYYEENGGRKYSAAELINQIAFDSLLPPVNQRILLVLLELKSKAFTDPTITNDDLRQVFGITKDNFLGWYRQRGYSEEKINEIASYPFGFQSQLVYVAEQLRLNDISTTGKRSPFHFADGSIAEPSYLVNGQTYALQKVMSEIAGSREAWQQWIGKEKGSFYNIYEAWFGDLD